MKVKPVIPREQGNRDVDEAVAYHLSEAGEAVTFGFIDALQPPMAALKETCSFRLRSCLVDGVCMNALVAREAKLKPARFGPVCGLFCAGDTQTCQAIGQQ